MKNVVFHDVPTAHYSLEYTYYRCGRVCFGYENGVWWILVIATLIGSCLSHWTPCVTSSTLVWSIESFGFQFCFQVFALTPFREPRPFYTVWNYVLSPNLLGVSSLCVNTWWRKSLNFWVQKKVILKHSKLDIILNSIATLEERFDVIQAEQVHLHYW